VNRGPWSGNPVIALLLLLGLLILGPKRLQTMLAHVARAKAELGNATRGLKSHLAAEIDAMPRAGKNDCSHVLVGDCELCSTHFERKQLETEGTASAGKHC